MKRFLFFTTLCVALAASAVAQTAGDAPSSREDVQRYLQVAHTREMSRQIIQAMSKPLHQLIHETYMKDKDSFPPDFETRMNQMMDDMLRETSFDKIEEKMIPIYQKHFTQGDLAALTEFYSSPTGQKVLKEMPSIIADSTQVTMPIYREQLDKMLSRLQDQMAQMKQTTKPGQKSSASQN